MTTLAHDATMLGIPVDTGRLFDGGDPSYELWIASLIERVHATKQRQARQEQRAMKGR